MPRALALFAFLLLARASPACMSYPELIAAEGEPTARDATAMPERPAQTVGLAADGGADEAADAGQEPPQSLRDAGQSDIEPEPKPKPKPEPDPEPEPRPCPECPAGTKCCEKSSKGKGEGGEIICKAPHAECSEDDRDDDD